MNREETQIEILNNLNEIWTGHKGLRFGQLLIVLGLVEHTPSLWERQDEFTLKYMKGFLKKVSDG